jgi:hypothetical protein
MAKENKEHPIEKIKAHFDYMRNFFTEYNAQLGEDGEKKLPEFTDEEMLIYSGHHDVVPPPPPSDFPPAD